MYLYFQCYFFLVYFVFFLGNDLDSIRALFSEKEKELSLAVAKVEALTKQLEELRRDRRGPLNLITAAGNAAAAVAAAGLNATNQVVSSNGLSINTTNNGTTNIQQHLNNGTSAARELDKLRRELMVSVSVTIFFIPFIHSFIHFNISFMAMLCHAIPFHSFKLVEFSVSRFL